jgi:putative transcriptional regulator
MGRMETLKGQFLVSMPDMGDERFAGTVIYLVGHSDEGAMGLVVNQSLEDVRFADVLNELKLGDENQLIRLPSSVRERKVLRGGPVERGRGFVLHSADYAGEGNSLAVDNGICLTATLDALKAVAFGPAPSQSLFALGYCGWAPGQLEAEIARNGWLTIPFSEQLLFNTPLEGRYDEALASLGIGRAFLSSTAGRA